MTQIGQFPKIVAPYRAGVIPTIAEETLYWQQYPNIEEYTDRQVASHISFSPLYPYDFLVVSTGRVECFDGETLKPKYVLNVRRFIPRCAQFRRDGRMIAIGVETGAVQLFDPNTRRVINTVKAFDGTCNHVTFTYDGKHVVATGEDGTLRVFDSETLDELACVYAHTDYIRDLQLTPFNQDLIATASYDRTVAIWSLSAILKAYKLDKVTEAQNGDKLSAPALPPSTVASLKGASKDPIRRFRHTQPVESITFLPGGSLIASARLLLLMLSSYLASFIQFLFSLNFFSVFFPLNLRPHPLLLFQTALPSASGI